MSRSDLVDVECGIHAFTEKAVRVSLDGDPSTGVWLPLSQIEIEEHSQSMATITMPEWLALDKGLI